MSGIVRKYKGLSCIRCGIEVYIFFVKEKALSVDAECFFVSYFVLLFVIRLYIISSRKFL